MNLLQPQIPSNLTSAQDLEHILNTEDDLSELLIENDFATGTETKGTSITYCSIVRSDLSFVSFGNFDISNTELKTVNLSGSKFPSSSWRAVIIDGCRCSGLELQDSTLKNLRFSNSKLDIVNFRFAKIENAVFENCILDDVDFYGATLKNVEFNNCTISKIAFGTAKMQNVNLSQSTIEAINGISSLKGATISYDQLMQLAPYFAAEAGIKVS